jgi:hypothetical protein
MKDDPLVDRAFEHFSPHGSTRADVEGCIHSLRYDDNLADTLIDEAIGQSIKANASRLAYLTKVARSFYAQRTQSWQ